MREVRSGFIECLISLAHRSARHRSYRRRNNRRPAELLEPRLMLAASPVLTYSTYLGGSLNDYASDVAVDSLGNSYVIGTTRSAQLAGFASADNGIDRAFLSKFTPTGELTYSKLLGPTPKFDASGYAESIGWQVVVGTDDLPLVSFETFETNTLALQAGGLLPLPGPPHLLHVEKLDAAGQPMWDVIAQVPEKPGHFDPIGFFGVHMTTDNLSDVYVTYTATRPTPGGGVGNDTFLTKLLSSGGQGVTDNLDSPVSAIAVDGPHNIYIAQTVVIEDRTTDVVITQYDPFFNLLKTATFGGTRDDLVSAVAVDPNQSGRVYLAGHTESNDFGGSRGDALTDIGLDFAGNVYVAGSTNSPDLPTAHALQACSPHPTVKNTMLASDCIQDTI